jgi:hypothetical protein
LAYLCGPEPQSDDLSSSPSEFSLSSGSTTLSTSSKKAKGPKKKKITYRRLKSIHSTARFKFKDPCFIRASRWHLEFSKRETTGFRGRSKELCKSRVMFEEHESSNERLKKLDDAGYKKISAV